MSNIGRSTTKEKILCAGFGGQGIMVMGKVLAEAAIMEDLKVTWMPAYGAEVRGGTAYSMVKISDEPISNPVIKKASTAILMNGPSLERFKKSVEKDGLVIVNTSLAGDLPGDISENMSGYPITEEAITLGNVKVANMVAIGILIGRKKIFSEKVLIDVIGLMAGDRKELVPINVEALRRGISLAEAQ